MLPAQLTEYWAATEDLRRVSEHLSFDQQTALPDGAQAARARQIGLLEDMRRQRIAADAHSVLLGSAQPEDEQEELLLSLARRDLQRERNRPLDLIGRFTVTGSEAFAAWRDARQAGDFAAFAPWLGQMVDLNREIAEKIGYSAHPMDALLSIYERGPAKTEVDTLFAALRPELIRHARNRYVTPVQPALPRPARTELMAFVHDLAQTLGYDWERGGVAIAPHPFTCTSGPADVRIAIRDDVPLPDIIKATMHELGHALYEQGIDPRLWGTPAGEGSMPYLHESQSKFYENILGRRADFADHVAGLVRRHIRGAKTVDGRALHTALVAEPSSVIRTADDEVGFNLHILLRWEVECGLLDRSLRVAEIPELWNERSREYFGAAPESAAKGCLQDPHWCHRYMGLFTGYVIGNLISAQLAEAMTRSGLSFSAAVSTADFGSILAWLRSNVHVPGRLYSTHEVVQRATGTAVSPQPYLDHISNRYQSPQMIA